MSVLLDALKRSEQERLEKVRANHDVGSVGGESSDDDSRITSHVSTELSSSDSTARLSSWWSSKYGLVLLVVVPIFVSLLATIVLMQFNRDASQGMLAQADDLTKSEAFEKTAVPIDNQSILGGEASSSDDSVVEAVESNDSETNNDTEYANDRIPSIYELESILRDKIPAIEFQSFIYSADSEYRSVTLNGKKMKEGDWLKGQLQLVSIGERQLTFELNGQLFTLPVMTDYTK